MGIEITPTYQMDFERKMNVRYSNAWKRTLSSENQWWRNVTLTQPSDSLEEFYEWMLETAQIRPTGSKGGELDFEDLVSISHSITNENFGTGLKLQRNQIEDGRIDRAAQWAASAGNAAAYWPQRQIAKLIQNGKTTTAYDGQNFFSAAHPVNPFDSSVGNYSNLFTGKPLTAANVASVVASIVSIIHPGNAPRFLKPSMLLVDPSNTLAAQQITNAEIITDPLNNTQGAPATNMIKRAYSFGQPETVPEFASEPGVWYLGVEADEDAFQGAFIYQERKAFELTSYTGLTQAQLDLINEFEWHLKGRNVAALGHPYLFFRIEPT